MLSARGVSVVQNGAKLVTGVNLDVEPGEVVSIIGANGAGKTTLLRALLGELPLTAGEVLINSQPIQTLPAHQLAQTVGLLSQHSHLQFPLLAEEVVALGRMPHATGAKSDARVVAQALTLMDLSYAAKRPFTLLSGGERQRVQLARVLAQIWPSKVESPRLLVLDEPTVSLDLGHKQAFMRVVKQFAQTGVAVLMVEHDLQLVAHYSDQLLALECGQPVAFGEVRKELTAPLIQQLFNAQVEVVERDGQLTVLNAKVV